MNQSLLRRLLFVNAAGGSGSLTEYEVTGNPVSFETNVAKPLTKMVIPFTPIQSGGGDPSPENVRPISGITGLTVTMCGKNLFDYANADIVNYKIRNSSGTEVADSTGSYCKFMIPVVPGAKYTYSGFAVNNTSKRVYFLDKDGVFISRSDAYKDAFTVTIPSNCFYCQLQNRENSNAGWESVQFELGEIASTFESYSGTTIPVSFPVEAGTVYGGELDLLSGVLTVGLAKVTLNGSESWSKNTGIGDYTIFTTGLSGSISVENTDNQIRCIANKLIGVAATKATGSSRAAYDVAIISKNRAYVVMLSSVASSATEMRNWISENNVDIVYELATPLVYSLTPQEIHTLIGTNTIWTNTNGTNTIKYMKKGASA